MSDELRNIGTATRLETANRHDEGTHWSDWYLGMTFDPGMSHETAPVVLRADAEAVIERLRAEVAKARDDALEEAAKAAQDRSVLHAARQARAYALRYDREGERQLALHQEALDVAASIRALKGKEG